MSEPGYDPRVWAARVIMSCPCLVTSSDHAHTITTTNTNRIEQIPRNKQHNKTVASPFALHDSHCFAWLVQVRSSELLLQTRRGNKTLENRISWYFYALCQHLDSLCMMTYKSVDFNITFCVLLSAFVEICNKYKKKVLHLTR